jgi:hypothetical protein
MAKRKGPGGVCGVHRGLGGDLSVSVGKNQPPPCEHEVSVCGESTAFMPPARLFHSTFVSGLPVNSRLRGAVVRTYSQMQSQL